MEYQPRPVDTSDVRLTADLRGLLEQLAEQVHEAWAARRLAEGWRYGECRDDQAKTHPCLVPYARLPETEKEYDRATVRQTLKTMANLGYCISRRDET